MAGENEVDKSFQFVQTLRGDPAHGDWCGSNWSREGGRVPVGVAMDFRITEEINSRTLDDNQHRCVSGYHLIHRAERGIFPLFYKP